MPTLRARERLAIGLGLGLVLSVGGYLHVLEPVLARQREAAEMIPAREATLEARRLLVAQRNQLAAEFETLRQQVDAASVGFLPGPSPRPSPPRRCRSS